VLGAVWGADGLDVDADPATLRVGPGVAKTRAGIRLVALDPQTRRVMQGHQARVGGVCGTPVFCDAAGRAFSHRGVVRGVFARTSSAARLGRVTPQVLRHTHASWAANAGARVPALAARLGHADPGFTLRRYAHPHRADADAIALLVAAARQQAA
jgi:integrase